MHYFISAVLKRIIVPMKKMLPMFVSVFLASSFLYTETPRFVILASIENQKVKAGEDFAVSARIKNSSDQYFEFENEKCLATFECFWVTNNPIVKLSCAYESTCTPNTPGKVLIKPYEIYEGKLYLNIDPKDVPKPLEQRLRPSETVKLKPPTVHVDFRLGFNTSLKSKSGPDPKQLKPVKMPKVEVIWSNPIRVAVRVNQ